MQTAGLAGAIRKQASGSVMSLGVAYQNEIGRLERMPLSTAALTVRAGIPSILRSADRRLHTLEHLRRKTIPATTFLKFYLHQTS